MPAPRPCLDCGQPHVRARGRCADCEAEFRAHYAGDWTATSKRIRTEHVATHGQVCPGWKRPAHTATDLTVDHVVAGSLSGGVQVLCRSCNTRKRNEVT